MPTRPPELADTERGALLQCLQRRQPLVWINPRRRPAASCLKDLPFAAADIADAEARWQRFAPLLETLFTELRQTHGVIESPLLPAPGLAGRILPPGSGRLFVKADHALPVAGSIKARGGIYAVLHFAEKVALEHGVLAGFSDDTRRLATPAARALFSGYELSVGSTGNLGPSHRHRRRRARLPGRRPHVGRSEGVKKERLRKRGSRSSNTPATPRLRRRPRPARPVRGTLHQTRELGRG